MTTYSKRRGRRSLAAIAAAMLMASVLAVVAGSPAQAANTSFEVLGVDTNNDGVNDARAFAGQDRYDTALRLAKNFATAKGGLGAVPTAFVASGETLVDSISVAGLAGYVDAPILLTSGDMLHGGVADFIEDYGVGMVYVLGGTAAVSDSVVTAIEALSNSPKVTRIAGADRYATAAAIAAKIDTDSTWCGTDAVSAVLINGATDMLGYGVAVQTVAYRLQLPVLMTAADELPDATAEYITANDVEHVQIIGGTGAVSADVAAALTTLGVDTVARVDGDSASAVSVALAQMAGNGCSDDLAPVSSTRVALVRANPDGVVGAPALATSIDGGNLVAPLIVGDTLPASVRDYLAATPQNIGGIRLNLGIVAIGGTAAVSESVMAAAIEAATSSGTLSVGIGAGDDPDTAAVDEADTNKDGVANADDPIRPGTRISLYFSDDVNYVADGTDGETRALLRDVIEVNGVPAAVASTSSASVGGSCNPRRINVTLTTALRHGDVVSVAGSKLKFGRAADQRTVASASANVMAAAADRTRPMISIIGVAGEASFHLRVDDAGANLPASIPTLVSAEGPTRNIVFTPGSGDATIGTVSAWTVDADGKSATATVGLTAGTLRTATTLVANDRITISANAVEDTVGPVSNKSAARSGTAVAAAASPRVNSVLMSNLNHSAQAALTVAADTTFGGGLATGGAQALTITAKKTGDAAGAAGNTWKVLFDVASTRMASKPLDIDVGVDPKGQQVTVRINNGTGTVGDLLAALRANSDFDERFTAGIPCAGNPAVALVPSNATANRNQALTNNGAGRTKFATVTRFNAYVDSIQADNLLAAVMQQTSVRLGAAVVALAGFENSPTGEQNPAAPLSMLRHEVTVNSAGFLPRAGDLVNIAAGTSTLSVAGGYVTDDAATANVDESLNGTSQRRIAVSSSVKAPS
ncbi:MAG: hypothetical protein F4169_04345 [Gammaproteobacteria bacterium]|nr:hypothetical protein [Gammaproteobacteria bacterium]